MKRLLVFISILAGFIAMSMTPMKPGVDTPHKVVKLDHATVVNYVKHTLKSASTWSPGGNMFMTFLVSEPAPNPNGRLPVLVIYLHGIDHRGPTPTSLSDFSTLDIVATKGVAALIATSDIPRMTRPGGVSPQDDYSYLVIAPQCSSSFSVWPVAYTGEVLNWAEANLAGHYDPTHIIVIGYSLGGGGALTVAGNSVINHKLSDIRAIAPGYNQALNYKNIADYGCHIAIYHSVNDLKAQIAVSDNFVKSVNAFHPVSTVDFFRFNDLPDTATYTEEHDIIWKRMLTQARGNIYTLTNNDAWLYYPMLQDCLGYTNLRKKRA